MLISFKEGTLSLLARAFSRARVLSLPCLSRSLSRLVSAGPLSLPALPSRIARLATRPFSARPHKTRCKNTQKKDTHTDPAHWTPSANTHCSNKLSHCSCRRRPLSSFLLFTALDSLFRVSYRHDTPAHTAPHLDARGHRRASCCCATTHTTTHKKRDRSENSHIERAARRRRFDSMTTATQRTSNRHAE